MTAPARPAGARAGTFNEGNRTRAGALSSNSLAAPAGSASRGSSPRRTSAGARGGVLSMLVVALLAAVGGALSGCASGNVTTSTGAVVPAATVQAQDFVADTLKALRTAHTQAVQIHDSRVGVEDPVLHRQHRQLLLDTGKGLDASWGVLAAWKARTQEAAPADVLRPLLAAGPAFCDLAVSFGLLKPEAAEKVKAFLAAIPPPASAPVGGAR